MSLAIAVPVLICSAAKDLVDFNATLRMAHVIAAVRATVAVAAGAEEVSVAIAVDGAGVFGGAGGNGGPGGSAGLLSWGRRHRRAAARRKPFTGLSSPAERVSGSPRRS